jgi:acyl carrier protein
VSVEDDRLIRCFQATFEGLAIEDVPGASVETVADWDSLHTVILAAVLEQEFELWIPAPAFVELRSYASVCDYLRRTISR